MGLEGFRRNLRGVNEGENFPEELLNDIFASIVRDEIRMSEATSMQVSASPFTLSLVRFFALSQG